MLLGSVEILSIKYTKLCWPISGASLVLISQLILPCQQMTATIGREDPITKTPINSGKMSDDRKLDCPLWHMAEQTEMAHIDKESERGERLNPRWRWRCSDNAAQRAQRCGGKEGGRNGMAHWSRSNISYRIGYAAARRGRRREREGEGEHGTDGVMVEGVGNVVSCAAVTQGEPKDSLNSQWIQPWIHPNLGMICPRRTLLFFLITPANHSVCVHTLSKPSPLHPPLISTPFAHSHTWTTAQFQGVLRFFSPSLARFIPAHKPRLLKVFLYTHYRGEP